MPAHALQLKKMKKRCGYCLKKKKRVRMSRIRTDAEDANSELTISSIDDDPAPFSLAPAPAHHDS